MKVYRWGHMAALAVLGLFLVACNGKEDAVVEPEPGPGTEEPVGPVDGGDMLKLQLTAGALEGAEWSVPEKVQVYTKEGYGTVLALREGRYSNDSVAETSEGQYVVLSPAAESYYNGKAVEIRFPEAQTAVTGTFPDSLCFALASGKGLTHTLSPLFCGLRLHIARDDISGLVIRATGGEGLSGLSRMSITDGAMERVNMQPALRYSAATGVLDKDKEWLVVMPPVILSQGLTITVKTLSSEYEYKTGALELQRGKLTTLIVPASPDFPTLGTGLRTMFITTPDGRSITSKTTWKENCTVRLLDDNGKLYYESSAVAVKGRGNSTWGFAKKPYALKLPEKFDLIGTGEDKRWVLLANWMDRTLLRNDVAFELGRRSGLEWTPSGEFIELYLNGKHLGNYWLGEKIKTGNKRLKADFLFEMDTYYDAQWKFYSSYGFRPNSNATGLPIGVKEPDDDKMTDALLNELKSLVSGVENAIYNKTADYRTKINVPSFIDWYLVHEVTYNGEPNHPKSCYFYFRDGVMYAGPLWDFDWYTFQPSVSGLFIPNSIYFKELFKDADFKAALKARWAELKPLWSTIPDYIDARAAEIHKSESINWSMWPCTSYDINGDVSLTFDKAITRMKNAFSARIKTLDTAINKL